MRLRKSIAVVLVPALHLWAVAALAETLHVPSQFEEIQLALDAASVGDTVLVAAGTYTNCHEGVCRDNVVVLREGVALVSEEGAGATVLELVPGGAGPVPTIVRADAIGVAGASIVGFSITSSIVPTRGIGLIGCENIRIESCRLSQLDGTGISAGGGVSQLGGSVEIVDCEFVACAGADVGAAISVVGGFNTYTTIRGCLFEECGPTAVIAQAWMECDVESSVFLNNFGTTSAGGLTLIDVTRASVIGCTFEGNRSSSGGALVTSALQNPEIRGNVFLRNVADGVDGGGAVYLAGTAALEANTFVGNEAFRGSAILDRHNAGSVTIRNNIFALNRGGPTYESLFVQRRGGCNLFWANDANFAGYTQAVSDLLEDPQFCDVPNDDYSLRSASPCAEANSPDCGQIGALGVGCGTVSVDRQSWGRLKSLFR